MTDNIDLKVKTTVNTRIEAKVETEAGNIWKATSQAKGIKIVQNDGYYGENILVADADFEDVLALLEAVVLAREEAKKSA